MPHNTRSVSFGQSSEKIPAPSGRSFILSIGIDRYHNIPHLRNAVKDARDVTQLLIARYQFGEAEVHYLFDDDATQKNIIQALKALVREVKQDDIVLIYFSGHGNVEEDINEGHWIPVDGDWENPGSHLANSVIVNYLRNIQSKHTFVIADSCFSGSMFMEDSMRTFAERQENIPSRWLMASGRGEVPDGKPGHNSPFAESLLLHLRENQREVLSVTALFRGVSEDVGSNHDQLPRCEPLRNVGHRGGEFALRLRTDVVSQTPLRPASAPATGTRRQEEAPQETFKPTRQKGLPEMVFVQGGTFQMGDKDIAPPVHSVTLSNFNIGKYPVTQKLWTEIMGKNPSHFKGDELPVENVSWDDCQDFIKKLNAKTGQHYRLPTEAEWEFAARGGTHSKGFQYAGSNDLKEVGWFSENANSQTHPVGQKKANEIGLYDMNGNVWEWCADRYGAYPVGAQTYPKGPDNGSHRVNRGGSWGSTAQICRVANRNRSTPGNRGSNLGFRLASSPQGGG